MANGKYITRTECRAAMVNVGVDVGMVKLAMVGADLRGGMVKDIADLNAKVDNLLNAKQCANEIGLKWKLVIFSASVSSFTALVTAIIRLV